MDGKVPDQALIAGARSADMSPRTDGLDGVEYRREEVCERSIEVWFTTVDPIVNAHCVCLHEGCLFDGRGSLSTVDYEVDPTSFRSHRTSAA